MSRARDLADAGSKANFLDNVTANIPADVQTSLDAKAPKDSPTFTGSVGLGSNAVGLFNGQISSAATFPAGSIVQVKQQKSDAFQNITGNINTMVNISGLNTSITIGANNKVLVQGMISCSSNYWAIALKLKRGINTSTLSDVNDSIGDNTGYTSQKKVMTSTMGATSGNGMHNDEMTQINFSYIDSPAQSSSSTIHYGVFVHSRGTSSEIIRINAPHDYTDNSAYITRGISTLILSEIQS